MVDRARCESFAFPLDDLLTDLFRLDGVPAAITEAVQPGVDLVFAKLRPCEALIHHAHEAGQVRCQCVALYTKAVALEGARTLDCQLFISRMPVEAGKRFSLRRWFTRLFPAWATTRYRPSSSL